jgi:hypothetical protein
LSIIRGQAGIEAAPGFDYARFIQEEGFQNMYCPSCSSPMNVEQFERYVVGRVALDICFPCNAIWFDPMESSELTPGSIIELFRQIHQHRNDARRLLSAQCRCPVCAAPLMLVNDLLRSGRFSYYRCPEGHGRLTSFFQFLREKQFVRSLTAVEISGLKAKVVQVRCSGCGAPIDLQKDSACSYCGSPISILDPDAVERMLKELQDGEQHRLTPEPAAFGTQPIGARRGLRQGGLDSPLFWTGPAEPGSGFAVDLLAVSISALAKVLFDD